MNRRREQTKTLRLMLRDADPTSAGDLASEEVAELRTRVLAARAVGREVATRRWRVPLLVLFSAGAALAIGVGLVTRGGERSAWEPTGGPQVAELLAEPSPAREQRSSAQRIEFETPEGLRIVWVINPDFALQAAQPPVQ